MGDLVADHRHAKDDMLAMILMLDLGHRHIEALAQLILDALHDLTLVFEGA